MPLAPDDPWPNDRILRLWQDLREELGVPADERFGSALWSVFSNNERVIDRDGNVVDVGTWRYAGGMVAALCGGDYLTYYMSDYRADEGLVAAVRAALADKGFTFTDFDEWTEGCLAGRYKIPPSWVDYFERRRADRRPTTEDHP